MAPRSENEKYYQDPMTMSRKAFPSLKDPHSKYLSVIIPAYKEVDRCKDKIWKMLDIKKDLIFCL